MLLRRRSTLSFSHLLRISHSGGGAPTPNISPFTARTYALTIPRSNSVNERVSQEREAGGSSGEGGGRVTPSSDLALRRLVTSLSPEQQALLLTELHRTQAEVARKKAEEKLASWRWRSRFGRPTSLYSPQPDPTGTYCAIPEEWLRKKAAEKNKSSKPSVAQLRQLAVHNALPFIGFGFLDNLVMIVAGDYIDTTIGTGLGISTMAAAALGNTISDLAGIGSAWYVENIAVKIGIKAPELSPEQLESMSARWSANVGRGAGVVLGCLIGMFPLLFLSDHEEEKKLKVEDSSVLK
ncbi:transmembrane protein 65-like isoform X4 [Eriocheir sinensis]|uniref:transmembrane protein 65-like isoform X1 n=1 Tax=Eriocheir sinensis TaxID=95602 RepID=UPI0021C648A8|nr:transmembrane protein 65-like isoform X1 [Eriocheir sinensis]XP_050704525.1 transmembrane protein 65-like isoform X2 [Eriocheir sinensis]XP_050704532.1 transmembrane protein 65-like isoform X3 [Eriocheir sinensis]XP_050704538.1 transmembrane protein 65-like isoform X4 [Eriocheir sinensis]